MNQLELHLNSYVYVDIGGITGKAKVLGIALLEQPSLGRLIIVDNSELVGIDRKIYPWPANTFFECYLKPIHDTW